jgi:non-ribosomal peptide synthetase component E (peptide arylation enzyme)
MLDDGEEIPRKALSLESLLSGSDSGKDLSKDLVQYRPNPNDVAIILLTGGTTGMPKGVPRTHNSYLTNIRYTNNDTTSDDIRALATPIGHSMAHQGPVGGCFFFGATLCLIAVPRPAPILEAVQRHKITMLSLVPTQLEDILNAPDLEAYDLSSIIRVRTAGAALRPETVKRAQAFFAGWGAEFVGGGFGSSEGPCASHRPGEPPEVFNHSIGRPMCDGDHWKVIDETEKELPHGETGELVAKGPCVFTGYYRSQEENAEIFTGDGYYKMGDIGKIDEEGHIFITGRKKDIIQRGGESIIPRDIEELLLLHPEILSAAVVGMPDLRLGEKICAYIVLAPGAHLSLEAMVNFLKSRGASLLQLPERLEVVGVLPKTPVRKTDKALLRKDIREKLEKEKASRARER